ncbi:hypothetical protein ES705_26745 [subsurface metagenome]
MTNGFSKWANALFVLVIFCSCESEKRIPPRGYLPNTPKATEQLEAAYFWIPQDQLNSAYWKDANFVEIELGNLASGNLYEEGYLNMTGTYSGLSDFNRGNDSKLTLKAGYDDEYIYILAEWKDTTANASYMSWLFDGPEDPRKTDTTNEWTLQRNQDKLTLLFDLEGSNTKDVWVWSLALSAPFDMAFNLATNEQGNITGDLANVQRNSEEAGSRAGPAFEWSGERQEITLIDGTRKLLDPAYYLLDGMKTDFIGDPFKGRTVFNETGDCKFCHGINGNGDYTGSDGGRLDKVSTLRYSRESLITFIESVGHEGSSDQYWGKIKTEEERQNLIAFMRGIAGLPGNYILQPESEPDIKALNNIGTGSIDSRNSEYRLLLKRKLNTGINGDVTFSPENTYSFTIRLSDNDDINYIGNSGTQLIFKSKDL